jgi:hypothetical protein
VKRAPRGAVVEVTMHVERTEKYKATTRSARAKHAINRFAIESRFEQRLGFLHILARPIERLKESTNSVESNLTIKPPNSGGLIVKFGTGI